MLISRGRLLRQICEPCFVLCQLSSIWSKLGQEAVNVMLVQARALDTTDVGFELSVVRSPSFLVKTLTWQSWLNTRPLHADYVALPCRCGQ